MVQRNLPSESDEERAKHFDEGMMRRGIAVSGGKGVASGRKTEGGEIAVIYVHENRGVFFHGVLSITATQSSPQLPRPNATRTILFNGNEILLAVM